MKNYDTIMTAMTVERMAELRVKLISVNGRELYYVTSSGQLYNMSEYNQAIQHEYNWLMYDPNPVKATEETTEDLKEIAKKDSNKASDKKAD